MFDWQTRARTLPSSPGVYIMKGKESEILYIGKAKDLSKRVRQYFQESGDPRPFVRQLPVLLEEIDVIITGTEKEALLLEASMIQEHQPRFNILLKEEQTYLYLLLDQNHAYPRLQVVRRKARRVRRNKNELVYGPYLSGYAVRQTATIIDRFFRLRTCSDKEFNNRARPCLEYQIKRCDAPCCFQLEEGHYEDHVNTVGMFLDGKHQELQDTLQERMWKSAENLKYEQAAQYRDQLAAIQKLLDERQKWKSRDHRDRDIFGIFREGLLVEIQILTMRQGQLSGGRSFSFAGQEFDDVDVLENFLSAYYLREGVEIPHIVWLPTTIESQDELAALLTERSGRQVTIHEPLRGQGKRLVEVANQNAEQGFLEKQKTEEANQELLERLQKRLRLERYPQRIECIDNSHLQGRHAVSAVVVYEGGYPNRSAYRRYHIKDVAPGDDFGSMKEILTRRFKRSAQSGELPDLLVVDGGRGQLGMALQVLEELNLQDIPTVGIAKKRSDDPEDTAFQDRIVLPNQKNAVPVNPRYRELLLLSQIRDQAHDTALKFHQKVRSRAKLYSILDDAPGIGPSRKRSLLRKFGSVEKIRQASLPDLAETPGLSLQLAESLLEYLEENPNE
ncbi:MAG: excinuclease ABC subunit UvrC [Deltaproteobacteria bacterium]|nr:MAG: excinuclease ABC subunit UvrC [Deltaproteobacteria bacterium]